jgi:predicted nuclease of predicted toxin-antitoxin system
VLFLVDAQLPPLLASALREAGCEAIHVADLGLVAATDRKIWAEAVSRSAVLVTKDRDFVLLRTANSDGPTVLWIRTGNSSNRTLIAQLLQFLEQIQSAIERGETIIEFLGR